MSDETKNVTLKSTSGAKVYPTATLDQLIADKDNSSSYVTRGGVIKREYLPREITVLIGCFDSAPDLDEVQNNDRYYNTTTKKVAVCWTNNSGEKEWSEGVPEQDRMFLDLSTACLMFFHDNDMYMCNSENASSLTSGVVVDSATNATSAKTAKAVDAAVSSAIISAAVESAGAVTGIASVVSGGTATITATGSTTSVDIVGTGGVNVKGNTNG
ncbi:MAG: hypothetical protein J5843_01140, partial [Clostridia bacterium]|nr:hypothetical protein [Clostridia bacterium]